MPDALERLVNLAMYLASTATPVSAEQVRANVEGYPAEQDEAAFRRMFERDKDDLRSSGFVIVSDAENSYRLDPSATFATEILLTPADTAALRAVGSAFLDDESFPFGAALRLAIAKLATDLAPEAIHAASRLAEESPAEQGAAVGALDRAVTSGKHATFDYVNAAGEKKHHDVEPYGLFVREGRWYLVGRDRDADTVRVYAVSRMDALKPNATRPKSPDFERPAEFDVRTYIALPFQYGAEEFEARIVFEPSQSWRAPTLTSGVGELEPAADGSTMWTVRARDGETLMRWLVANGPGLHLVSPPGLAAALSSRLEAVAAAHA